MGVLAAPLPFFSHSRSHESQRLPSSRGRYSPPPPPPTSSFIVRRTSYPSREDCTSSVLVLYKVEKLLERRSSAHRRTPPKHTCGDSFSNTFVYRTAPPSPPSFLHSLHRPLHSSFSFSGFIRCAEHKRAVKGSHLLHHLHSFASHAKETHIPAQARATTG
jgi:hypothetical protein